MVLVHGWCGNRHQMTALGEAFADELQILAPDLPGHGESPRVEIPSFDAYAAALVQFLDGRDLQDVILVGHSMGGVLSVMAGGRSDRVGEVVNLDGALPLTDAGRAGYAEFFEDVRREGFKQPTEAFIRRAFFLPTEGGPVMEELIAGMMSMPEDLGAALLAQFPTIDGASILKSCRTSVSYIGSSKPRFDADMAKMIRPDLKVATVADSGHFIQIFAVPQVVALIRSLDIL